MKVYSLQRRGSGFRVSGEWCRIERETRLTNVVKLANFGNS